jgi:hypothetical protein
LQKPFVHAACASHWSLKRPSEYRFSAESVQITGCFNKGMGRWLLSAQKTQKRMLQPNFALALWSLFTLPYTDIIAWIIIIVLKICLSQFTLP